MNEINANLFKPQNEDSIGLVEKREKKKTADIWVGPNEEIIEEAKVVENKILMEKENGCWEDKSIQFPETQLEDKEIKINQRRMKSDSIFERKEFSNFLDSIPLEISNTPQKALFKWRDPKSFAAYETTNNSTNKMSFNKFEVSFSVFKF